MLILIISYSISHIYFNRFSFIDVSLFIRSTLQTCFDLYPCTFFRFWLDINLKYTSYILNDFSLFPFADYWSRQPYHIVNCPGGLQDSAHALSPRSESPVQRGALGILSNVNFNYFSRTVAHNVGVGGFAHVDIHKEKVRRNENTKQIWNVTFSIQFATCQLHNWFFALQNMYRLIMWILFCPGMELDTNCWFYIYRKDYHQVNEAEPYLPAPAASQAIAARTLQRSQGSSYPPDTPPPSYMSAMMHNRLLASAPMHEAQSLMYIIIFLFYFCFECSLIVFRKRSVDYLRLCFVDVVHVENIESSRS